MTGYLRGSLAPTPEQELSVAAPYHLQPPQSVGLWEGLKEGLGTVARTLAGEEQQAIHNQLLQQQQAQQEAERQWRHQMEQQRLEQTQRYYDMLTQQRRQTAAQREQQRKLHKEAMRATQGLVRSALALDPSNLAPDEVVQHAQGLLRQFYDVAPQFRSERAQRAALLRLQNTPLFSRYAQLLHQRQQSHTAVDPVIRLVPKQAFSLHGAYLDATAQAQQWKRVMDSTRPGSLGYSDAQERLAEAEAKRTAAWQRLYTLVHDERLSEHVPSSIRQFVLRYEQQAAAQQAAAQQAAAQQVLPLNTPGLARPSRYRLAPGADGGVRIWFRRGKEWIPLTPDEYNQIKQHYTNLPHWQKLPAVGGEAGAR